MDIHPQLPFLLRSISLDVDILRLQFGINNDLLSIKAEVTGKHIADRAGQQEEQKGAVAHIGYAARKQFQPQQQGGDRAVGYTAEQRGQADGRPESRVQSQQGSDGTAKSSPHKKGGNDLSTLKAAAQGDGCKNQLENKSPGTTVPEAA